MCSLTYRPRQAAGESGRHHRVAAQGRHQGLGPDGRQDGDGGGHLLRQQTLPPQHADPGADQKAHGGAEPARCAVRAQQDRHQAALHIGVRRREAAAQSASRYLSTETVHMATNLLIINN